MLTPSLSAIDLTKPWPRGRGDLLKSLASLSDQALSYLHQDLSDPVRASLDPSVFSQRFNLELPTEGRDVEEVLAHAAAVLSAAPSTSGPRFFNQLFAGRDPIGAPVDMLASLGNHSMYTYKAAGALILIENLLIQALGERVGYEQCGGLFTPGGSLSNLVAMLCARDAINSDYKETGLPQGCRVYTSSESHYSIKKAAGLVGIGRANVIGISVDEEGRLCPKSLRAHIEKDRAEGLTPLMINATAGTTVRGAFDPFVEIAKIAKEFDVWFHIDGAFGGTALWDEDLAKSLRGCEHADSFTWDAHKAMGVPLTCSVLLTKDALSPNRSLSENASYLFQSNSDHLNPGTRSLQCGRRNDALKLWASWQYHGTEGWGQRIRRQRALALTLAELISNRATFTLTEPPPFLNVCFEYTGHSSEEICERLQIERRALIGYGRVKGRNVIRAALINPELTLSDLEDLLDSIEAVACSESQL